MKQGVETVALDSDVGRRPCIAQFFEGGLRQSLGFVEGAIM